MHPILLAGAVLVGLPVVLHLLLKQEPKRLLFPALRFLKLKQKSSERKIRLRHFLLLALRCLLIALFALALYQPKAQSSGLNLSGEEPVAAVLVIDTSPSMGYRSNNVTRLGEARRRALALLDELPPNSRIAVIDPNDLVSGWEPSAMDARRRIEALKEPAGSSPPITTTLAAVYQLLRNADQEVGDGGEPLPRLIAVFSDRATNSWDVSRHDELKALRDSVPSPAPVHMFFDVGVEKPSNVVIVSAEMKPQRLSGSADAFVSVILRADGNDVPNSKVTAQLDTKPPQEMDVSLSAGSPKAIAFRFSNAELKTGFHTITVSIRDDALSSDNTRTLTFEIAPRRKILAISDQPQTAEAWELAHNFGKQEFDCSVMPSDPIPDLSGYEAVTLIGVKDPQPLAKRVFEYVDAGGKLVIIPDGPDSDSARGKLYNESLDVLLPARLGDLSGKWEPARGDAKRAKGVPWKIDDDRDLAHPLLAPLREFKRQGNVDIFDESRQRLTTQYRLVSPLQPNSSVVAYFDNSDTPTERAPALMERTVGAGRVLLLTTRFDFAASADGPGFWNDYLRLDGHSWPTVLPWMMLRYLCGSPDDAAYNFPTGVDVTVPLPTFDPAAKRVVIVEGPGILPRDATVELGERQSELRLVPPVTLSAGPYIVRTKDETNPWEHRFSLNTPAIESVLEKVPEESIKELFGPNGVTPVDRDIAFTDLLTARLDRPIELFPYLMILVLLFFAVEGFVANRFYRLRA